MYRYKTIVTDYEGMQESLTTYGTQGWRLVSVTPDTLRFIMAKDGEQDNLGLGPSAIPGDAVNTRELSASYYLLVFERQDDLYGAMSIDAEKEPLEMQNFSLPDY